MGILRCLTVESATNHLVESSNSLSKFFPSFDLAQGFSYGGQKKYLTETDRQADIRHTHRCVSETLIQADFPQLSQNLAWRGISAPQKIQNLELDVFF